MTRVADLTGAELDLWVAKAAGVDAVMSDAYPDGSRSAVTFYCRDHDGILEGRCYSPSKHWSDGGPIIERERLVVWPYSILDQDDRAAGRQQDYAAKRIGMLDPEGVGPSYLIAAMRAFVASKFGETVEVAP